jgi:hypothetical protein
MDLPFGNSVKIFVTEFNQRMERYTEALLPPDIYRKEVRSIVALSAVAFETALTCEQVEGCLAALQADPTAELSWTGVLPLREISVPGIIYGPFTGKGGRLVTLATLVKPTSPTSFTAIARRRAEWTGLQLHSLGLYTIDLFPLGHAQVSLGEDWKPKFRCTLGNDILTPQEHSYSLSGKLQMRHDGAWEVRDAEPLDIRLPVQILITQHEVQITQKGTLFARFLRVGKPVLLGFQHLLLSVSFEERVAPPLPVPTPSAFARLSEAS